MNPLKAFADHWGEPSSIEPLSIEPLGAGHINHTWLVGESGERWVLQQINRRVFVDPQLVMHNTQRVLAHIDSKRVPSLRLTRDQQGFALIDGEVWRVWRFVAGSVARKHPETIPQALAAGAAFGAFQRSLADLPPPSLVPPIEGFHDLEHFLRRFDALQVESEWRDVIERHRPLTRVFGRATGHVHGDCKFENLLFAQGSDEVLAVVDLDTLMPGHWGLDWGDLVRSAFVQSGQVEPSVFKAMARGFMPHLQRPTIDEIVLAPRYVATTLGVRYLVDHAEGDVWFKVSERGENLMRAARQFRFVQHCMAHEDMMRACIDQVCVDASIPIFQPPLS